MKQGPEENKDISVDQIMKQFAEENKDSVAVVEETDFNSREYNIFQLKHRWRCLLEDVWEDEFDREYFQHLAIDTYQFLFALNDGVSDIPRDIVDLLFSIGKFAVDPFSGSNECNVAQQIAGAICTQFVDGWLGIDGAPTQEKFGFEDFNGDLCVLPADTFDLSAIERF